MKPKLSKAQRRALEAIRAAGGWTVAEGGGWWKGANGERLYIAASTTIYALERRGYLRRRGTSPHAWRDSSEVV
jgi:hypothetical protein